MTNDLGQIRNRIQNARVRIISAALARREMAQSYDMHGKDLIAGDFVCDVTQGRVGSIESIDIIPGCATVTFFDIGSSQVVSRLFLRKIMNEG